MSRVRLDLPKRFLFTTEVTLRVSDINYGGHLGNDAVLSLAQEARIRFLRSRGWSEQDVAGVGIIMTDAVVVYGSEAFYGDVLTIDVAGQICQRLAGSPADTYIEHRKRVDRKEGRVFVPFPSLELLKREHNRHNRLDFVGNQLRE